MKNELEKYDSIIFDLDGTLWDSTETCLNSWNEVIGKKDYEQPLITEQQLKGIFGMKFDKIADVLFPSLDSGQKRELLQECMAYGNEYIKLNGGQLYDRLEEVLKSLSKTHRLFIVSNCQGGYIESFLEFYGLDEYFEDFECPGNTGLEKSENIRLVVERNQLQSPIYVGDTVGDQLAAQANGIPFLFANYGFGDVQEAEMVLQALSDLLT